jgi:SAM-dependent methyltransferase
MATGTGDLAIERARRVGPHGEVIRVDFSAKMLDLARAKAPTLRFDEGDTLALPYANDEFDAATCGYGARNFADLEHGLSELSRVVKPTGRIMLLELTTPRRSPLSSFSTGAGSTSLPRCSADSPETRRPTRTSPARYASSAARNNSPQACRDPALSPREQHLAARGRTPRLRGLQGRRRLPVRPAPRGARTSCARGDREGADRR